MLEFSAYLTAQHLTREAVNEAHREAPARAERVPLAQRPAAVAVRQWHSLALRRLADDIAPTSGRAGSAMRATSGHCAC
jgi:hypothetical protein